MDPRLQTACEIIENKSLIILEYIPYEDTIYNSIGIGGWTYTKYCGSATFYIETCAKCWEQSFGEIETFCMFVEYIAERNKKRYFQHLTRPISKSKCDLTILWNSFWITNCICLYPYFLTNTNTSEPQSLICSYKYISVYKTDGKSVLLVNDKEENLFETVQYEIVREGYVVKCQRISIECIWEILFWIYNIWMDKLMKNSVVYSYALQNIYLQKELMNTSSKTYSFYDVVRLAIPYYVPYSLYECIQTPKLYALERYRNKLEMVKFKESSAHEYAHAYICCLYQIVQKFRPIHNADYTPVKAVYTFKYDDGCNGYYEEETHCIYLSDTNDYPQIKSIRNIPEVYGGNRHSVCIHEMLHALLRKQTKTSLHPNVIYRKKKVDFDSAVKLLFDDIMKYGKKELKQWIIQHQ